MQLLYDKGAGYGDVVDGTKTVGESARYSWNDKLKICCYLPANNARHHIEELLTTETSPGLYCTGSEITGVPIPSVEILLHNDSGITVGRKKLSFPLDDKGIEDIKSTASRAGVGLPDRTVVNLDVRKT